VVPIFTERPAEAAADRRGTHVGPSTPESNSRGSRRARVARCSTSIGAEACARSGSHATVTARHHSRVHALERADFLAAVTGHPAGVPAGHSVVQERLTTRADQDHPPLREQTPTVRVDAHAALSSG
jgi:hypothetical protein